MKMPLLRAALLTSTLAAVLVPAGAASAASFTVADATGDTWALDMSSNSETYVPAGSQVNVDVARTVIRHGAGRLVVTSTYADLKRSGNRSLLAVRLRTNEGVKREVDVETLSRPGWGGDHHFSKPSGREVACRGLAHEIDYVANTVRVVVPTACLSRPRWVQASIGTFGMSEDQQDSNIYVDNGHDETSNDPGWSAKVRKG